MAASDILDTGVVRGDISVYIRIGVMKMESNDNTRWVLKHKATGRYVSSRRVLVVSKNCARKFNSARQARIYLKRAQNYNKEDFMVTTYGKRPVDADKLLIRAVNKLYSDIFDDPVRFCDLKNKPYEPDNKGD